MNATLGILLKLGAVACFVIMSALIKSTADMVPPGEAVFFRSAFAFPVIFIWIVATGKLREAVRVVSPVGHFWRGLIGITAMVLGFTSLGYLPLPEVTALGYLAPLATVVLAAIILKEQVGLVRLSAVGMGLIGVIIVLEPRLSIFYADQFDQGAIIGVVCILGSAVLAALAQIHIRRLINTERPTAIVFYFTLTGTALSFLTLPFGWVIPDAVFATRLILAGLIGGLGQIMLTNSYRFAPVSVVAPFDYASLIFASIIGYVIFGELPTAQMLFGAGIVVAAGIFIIYREHRLGLKRGRARQLKTPNG